MILSHPFGVRGESFDVAHQSTAVARSLFSLKRRSEQLELRQLLF